MLWQDSCFAGVGFVLEFDLASRIHLIESLLECNERRRMWIVRLALRRPYTFVVMAILIAILGGVAIFTTRTDIFPDINIPVVSVVWTFSGISPDEMEKRIVTVSERAMTTTVNDIEHIESQSYNGVSVTKLFFQPNVKVELALAQVTAIVQTILRVLP